MDVRRILYVMWKEVIELRQDPRIFAIIFLAPVVQLAVLGYAATTDVRNVPFVVVDADRSPASQDLIGRFTGSGIFELVDIVTDTRAVDKYLESGQAWMALSIPADYGEDVSAGRTASLQMLADGSDANSTNIALGYAANLVTGYAQELMEQRKRAAGGVLTLLEASSQECVCGSTRRSKAATSCCRASSPCCCLSSPRVCRRWRLCASARSARSNS